MREYTIYAVARYLDLKQFAESFIRHCVKIEALKILTGRPVSVSITYGQIDNDIYALFYALFYLGLTNKSSGYAEHNLQNCFEYSI